MYMEKERTVLLGKIKHYLRHETKGKKKTKFHLTWYQVNTRVVDVLAIQGPNLAQIFNNPVVHLLHASLTHWGRVTHICVCNLIIIDSDNGLLPERSQAIIWTNAEILLIGSLGTNFSEILIEILTFLFKKMHLKILSTKWQPFCLGLNVLIHAWLNLLRGCFQLFV